MGSPSACPPLPISSSVSSGTDVQVRAILRISRNSRSGGGRWWCCFPASPRIIQSFTLTRSRSFPPEENCSPPLPLPPEFLKYNLSHSAPPPSHQASSSPLGVSLAKKGARVVATDRGEVLGLLRRNIAENFPTGSGCAPIEVRYPFSRCHNSCIWNVWISKLI